MADAPPPTVVNADPAGASLSPEELLRRQADLAELAFGSLGEASSTQHLAFLPPEELELDLEDPDQRELGDYTLLEKIGQGGMGVVYRAHQKSLDREVALKLLSAGPWASRDFIERFRREAQSAARMQHPNIVAIHEIGRHEELNFFSMRLVRGPSLASRLSRDGPMQPRQAAQLLATVAEAVDYAHRLAVLHLDLKPGNVLIDEQGEPLVADFGLARRMDETLGHDSDEVSGTPSYMAPEQALVRSHRLSAATDIYGLGAILYQALTGQPPFLGRTPLETLERVAMLAPEPPRRLRADIPADLDAICLKCLCKAPHDRYPSARALADDLLRFLEGRDVSVRTPGRLERIGRWTRREPRVALAAAAGVLALLAGLVATSQQWLRAEGNAHASRELLWESRREAARQAAMSGDGLGATRLLLGNIAEQEGSGDAADTDLDRRQLGILLGQGATLIDAIAIADANPLATALSEDGERLALAFNDHSVRWYDTASLTERGRIRLDDRRSADGQPRTLQFLRFVGNDRLVASFEWYANLVNPANIDSWLLDLESGRVVEPPPAFADYADAVFADDGRRALLRNRSRQVQLWQVDPWQPLSPLAAPIGTDSDFLPWLLAADGLGIALGVDMREILRIDLASMTAWPAVRLPGDAGVSAWALSGDGRTLALGDYEGRLFLLDLRSGSLRVLPAARGREVIWVAFSGDGQWLASGSFDGSVQAFDVASGDSLVAGGAMKHGFAVTRVAIDRGQRLLLAAGQGATALWRLRDGAGPRALPPHRIGHGPAAHAVAGRYPVAWSLSAGLLASAGVDGRVRLWRLPGPHMPPALAARQVPERTEFASARLVDVNWNQLRLVSPEGRALGPGLALSQPPGFAELVDRGRTLVVTVGPELRVYDSDLRLRFAPVALPASPQRLLTSHDASRVLLSFGGQGDAGFVDELQQWSLLDGRRLGAAIRLAGPQRMLAYAPDDRRIVAVGPAEGATAVLESEPLRLIADFPHDPFQPVLRAAFAGADDALWLVTQASDPRLGEDSLIAWRPRTNQVLTRRPTGPARPIGVLALPGGAFVAGAAQNQIHADGRLRTNDHDGRFEAMAIVALSPDQRLVAHAFRHLVRLYDVASAREVGVPLISEGNALDVIVQLAFSEDGNALLGRTLQGRWQVWAIAPERRPVGDLAAELGHLAQEDRGSTFVPALGEAARRALRERDAGPWTPLQAPVPLPEFPPRDPQTPANSLDLGPVYNRGPEAVHNTFHNIRSQMRPYPAGLQRIRGVDFEMRGMAQLGRSPDPRQGPTSACVATPPTPLAAVHLLLKPSLRSPAATGTAIAAVRWRYRDGGQVLAPLRAGVEVPGHAGEDHQVPFAFSVSLAAPAMGGYAGEVLVAPRVTNPAPTRPVRCIELLASSSMQPLLLFAMTVEPSASPAGSSAAPDPVIGD